MLIAQLSDLHIRAGGALAYNEVDTLQFLRAAVAHLNALRPAPACVVVSGDLGDLGTLDEYAILRAELDKLAMPYHPIPGNHDGDAFWDVFADRMTEPTRHVGHVVDLGAQRIVMLDTRVDGQQHGLIDDARADWLKQRLRESETPALVVMHHPPIKTGIGHMDLIGLQGKDRLREILQIVPPPMAILCGHIHRTIISNIGGTPVIVAPSAAHAVSLDIGPDAPSSFHMEPPGMLLHKVEDGTLTTHLSLIGQWPGPYPFFNGDSRLIGT